MNKIRIIISSTILLFLSVNLLASVSVNENEKNKILSIANSISLASEEQDISGIMMNLSSDVIINIGNSNKTPRSYTYQTYGQYLSKVFPLVSYYNYKRSNELFNKLPNNEYSFEFVLKEMYVFNNKYINETHSEIWHLKLVGESLKVYKILIDQ